MGQDGVRPEERVGDLWDLYRSLHKEGYKLDGNGYTTSFRVHPGIKTNKDLEQIVKECPPGLSSSFNIGAADFYPETSGKVRAEDFSIPLHLDQGCGLCKGNGSGLRLRRAAP